jgi:hypothetical protein
MYLNQEPKQIMWLHPPDGGNKTSKANVVGDECSDGTGSTTGALSKFRGTREWSKNAAPGNENGGIGHPERAIGCESYSGEWMSVYINPNAKEKCQMGANVERQMVCWIRLTCTTKDVGTLPLENSHMPAMEKKGGRDGLEVSRKNVVAFVHCS